MMLREDVVDEEVFSWMCWARWEMKYCGLPETFRTLPDPEYIWRVTKNGMSCSVTFQKSTSRRIK